MYIENFLRIDRVTELPNGHTDAYLRQSGVIWRIPRSIETCQNSNREAPLAVPAIAQLPGESKTYVLVHGAWHGGLPA